ncbi:swarming motility YbiA-like protein [Rhizobium phage RHph_I46]|uniref:Swarming motility YbiA-like protein n=1 Tax=Rhizobium phage RHph_I1_9 TaxID=2509729 RepID=A0A7S5R9A1_9CAUD|nr:swarming motility YbiA-like protein [Rhizobium phage RHph_I1_9]QIG69605.1 swarming motility YbiA-like protein [Rhizobium phage RHph_I46]QIG70886.1 swarming motility YbiA-like protein [Rhizobium phage RHph_I9]QIG73472.1 swarming motility YbiA-like protein [Rhizobium phage RHph_I1_9]QIG76225.1 swarming motility YbiA-like protein [Rhizobium phage RHph_I34]
MDVGSGNSWPSNALSNFAPHPFAFRGVECNSMEGLLQSLKFDKPHIQIEVCKLVGYAAKKRGRPRNKQWQKLQVLWWNGEPMSRTSTSYQEFLCEAFDSLSKNTSFARALLATQNSSLTHSIGHSDLSKTVLTEREFCRQLYRVRDILKKEVAV